MDYSKPNLANQLAADYALGTMRGAARRRMESLMTAHPVLRRAVARWEDQLAGLSAHGASREAMQPSPQVWQGVEQRLFGQPSTAAQQSMHAKGSWWQSILLWRTWSAVASVGALALLVTLGQTSRDGASGAGGPPVIVVLQANPEVVNVAGAVQASFVASVSADGKALVLKPLGDVMMTAGRALELWAVPAQGAPKSLGLVRADAPTTLLRAQFLQGTAALAVSVEPAGGSPTGAPTGPVVSVGKVSI